MHPVIVVIALAWAVLNLLVAFAARVDLATAGVFVLAGALTALGATSLGDPAVLVAGLLLSVCGPLLYALRVQHALTWWHHAVRVALVAGLGALYLVP